MASQSPIHRGNSGEHLLATAAKLFAEQSYRGATLDDVAAVLGVRKASLYHYIADKEQLLVEIYSRLMDRAERDIRPLARADLPPDEKLRRMVLAHIKLATEERDMLAVVVREEAELNQADRTKIIGRKHAYEGMFERVIAEGQKQGYFRPMTPRLVVLALLGACNWIYNWYRPDRYSASEIAGEFVLLLERGWLGDGEDRPRVLARADTLQDALAGVDTTIATLRGAVEQLSEELDMARQRLADGLAPGTEAGGAKARTATARRRRRTP